MDEDETDDQTQIELENAYLDCRETFIRDMIKEGRDDDYIKGRLEWLDEMYGESLQNIQNIMDSLDTEEGGEGCEI